VDSLGVENVGFYLSKCACDGGGGGGGGGSGVC
jgi:hypothetical protein